MGRRLGAFLGMIVLALGVMGLVSPSPRSLQLWPDHTAGVSSGLLEGMPAHADSQVLPFGVHRLSADDVVRARTYLNFPLDVFPPGTEIVRATLHVYVDSASDAGEALFGAYRVLEPWEEEGWGEDPTTWPALLTVPIAATTARFDALTPADTSRPFSKPAGHGLLQGTMVTIDPPSVNVALGATTEVNIRIENVTGLYSADVFLTFDSTLLEVVDADPITTPDDVEIEPGAFLNPDFVVENVVYQDEGEIYDGEIYFAIAQQEPVSGSGVLATITFRGKAVGTSAVDFGVDVDDVFLGDHDGESISAGIQNGSVTVIEQEDPVPTTPPTSTSTPGPSPTPTSTSIPGVTPTSPTSPLPTPPPFTSPTPTVPSPTSPLPTPTSSLPLAVPVVALQQGAGIWLTWDVTALMRAWQAGEATNHGLALAPAPDPDADPETTG
ncbi:MAG: hypothetical protein KAW49_12715, partial [Anaerolineae bacterium]|nr:hypothetical protein [Anaerolineae bacterium]